MDERIMQKSLAEHIVEDLEEKIVDGTLKPGQRVIEENLCKSFGVSRSPVKTWPRCPPQDAQRISVRWPSASA